MGPGEVARHPGEQQEEREQDIVVAEIVGELDSEQRRPRHEQALPPAGEPFPFEQHLLHEQGEAQRRDGEVVSLNAQRGEGDERAEHGGDRSADGDADQHPNGGHGR